jgi:hypothetical protein
MGLWKDHPVVANTLLALGALVTISQVYAIYFKPPPTQAAQCSYVIWETPGVGLKGQYERVRRFVLAVSGSGIENDVHGYMVAESDKLNSLAIIAKGCPTAPTG